MSYAFRTLKRQIDEAGNGEGKYSIKELDDMVYKKYQTGRLTDKEYNDLCSLLEYIG